MKLKKSSNNESITHNQKASTQLIDVDDVIFEKGEEIFLNVKNQITDLFDQNNTFHKI